MKICSKCNLTKVTEEFPRNSSSKDGFGKCCKPCQRLYVNGHYLKNKDYYKNKAKNHSKAMRKVVLEHKDYPCTDCGVSYPYYVMDFDHVQGKKKSNIAHMSNGSYSKEEILNEIDKCEIVCSNCHRIRTHGSVV